MFAVLTVPRASSSASARICWALSSAWARIAPVRSPTRSSSFFTASERVSSPPPVSSQSARRPRNFSTSCLSYPRRAEGKVAFLMRSRLVWSTPMLGTLLELAPGIDRDGLIAGVIVEPAPRLPPEVPGLDHLLERVRRGEALLAVGVDHYVGDRPQRVESDEVRKRERPHRVAGAGHHPGVDGLDRSNALLLGADRIQHVGDQQAVDDEAPVVVRSHRGLAELLPHLEAEVHSGVPRLLGTDHLEQRHH